MDSRDYICSFTIDGASDLPSDFVLPAWISEPFAGVFLPQSGWFPKTLYPARVVLMRPDGLSIVPHPSSRELPLQIPFDSLHMTECGRVLLLGWIRLRSEKHDAMLRYSRRTYRPVEKFLARLRAQWLRNPKAWSGLRHCGAPLDSKYSHALALEADEGETTGFRFFQPPVEKESRRYLIRFRSWAAGDLLMVTDRRLLWITDRHGRIQDPYGTVSRSAPLAMVASVRYRVVSDRPYIQVALRRSEVWSIPISEGQRAEAIRFSEAVAASMENLKFSPAGNGPVELDYEDIDPIGHPREH